MHVSITGAAVQSAVVACVSGAWSYTTSPALTDSGTYQASATQGDTAGNTGSSGSRSLTIDRAILDFTISGGGVDSLYPGNDPQSLDLSITNPNSFAIKVTSITVSIQSETLNGTCSTADNFTIVQGLLTPVVIAANSTQSLSDAGVAAGDRPQIQMLETHVNQDECKGVTIHFNYSGTAEKP